MKERAGICVDKREIARDLRRQKTAGGNAWGGEADHRIRTCMEDSDEEKRGGPKEGRT